MSSIHRNLRNATTNNVHMTACQVQIGVPDHGATRCGNAPAVEHVHHSARSKLLAQLVFI